MTTSVTEGFTPFSPTGEGQSSVFGMLANNGAPEGNASAQLQAAPNVVPQAEAPFGDPGDWGTWGAVALGTAALAPKLSTNVTQPLKADLLAKHENLIRFQNSPTAVQERVKALQSAREAANPSSLTRLREGTAGARSVFQKFGANVVDKAAARVPTGRTVVNLSRGATRAVASRMGPRAAAMGARLGLRLAVFAIPGPGWAIGAAVLAATWLFDSSMRRAVNNLFGKMFGVNNSPALDTPPEPPRTQFLPLTHDGDRDSVIDVKDAEMVQLNDAAFKFDPNKVWHPTAPVIETTPTFEAATQKIADLITEAVSVRDELDAILRKYRGEQVVDRAGESMKEAINTLDELGVTVLPKLSDLIAVTATDINSLYMKLRDANSSARQEIANSGAGLFPWTADVEASNMGQLAGELEKFAQKQDQDITAVNAILTEWKPPTSSNSSLGIPMLPEALNPPIDRRSQGRAENGESGGSGPSTPFSTTPRTDSEPKSNGASKDGGTSKQAIADALRGIGTPAAMSGQNPSSQVPNPLSQMQNPLNRMNSPFGQMGANPFGQMSNPLAQMQNPFGQPGAAGNALPAALQQPANGGGKTDTPKLESKLRDLLGTDKAKDVVAEKRSDKAKNEEQPEQAPKAEDEPKADAPATDEPKATPSPLPAALGLDNPAPGDPAADAGPKDRTIEIEGKKVEFEDPRSARMAEILKPADGSTGVTVQEAAKQAGYSLPPAGQPIGAPINPADLRPGDLIMGAEDRNGLYLGDGKVLTGGEVRPVADVAHFTGDGQGIFRLDDGAPALAPAGDSAAPAPAGDAAAPAPAPTGDAPAPAPAPAGDSAAPAPAGDAPAPAPAPTGDPAAPSPAGDAGNAAPGAPGDTPSAERAAAGTTEDGQGPASSIAGGDSSPAEPSAPTGSGMPMPHASIPTSDTGSETGSAAPTVPVGD